LASKNSSACNPTWFDDFSDYRSGWGINNTSSYLTNYTGEEYQILVKNTSWSIMMTPGIQISDGVIVVDMRFASAQGDSSEYGGILFGLDPNNSQNYYHFVVQRNDRYCIRRHNSSSGWTDLSCATAAGFLAYPASNNHLKLVRNGSGITAYINGQFLATVSDSTYLGSLRVGLTAAAYTINNADVRFDNYGIYPLACSDQVNLQ
jgi:hypothetical protein